MRIQEIMARLRAPDGCAWDREQTPESLRKYVLEEAYEVCDAIESGDPEAIREELGDLLLQVVFQSQIAKERGWFDLAGVDDAISSKMTHRHPHVFGDERERAMSADEVARQWEERKAMEKGTRGLFDGIPKAMPALSRATTAVSRAALAGRSPPGGPDPLANALEHLAQLGAPPAPDAVGADRSDSPEALHFGQALLSLVEAARQRGIEPNASLGRALSSWMTSVE